MDKLTAYKIFIGVCALVQIAASIMYGFGMIGMIIALSQGFNAAILLTMILSTVGFLVGTAMFVVGIIKVANEAIELEESMEVEA